MTKVETELVEMDLLTREVNLLHNNNGGSANMTKVEGELQEVDMLTRQE